MAHQVALVTGSAGGIGAAICGRLRSAGWTVVGADLADADIDADLTVTGENERVVTETIELHGRLDVVIANAGAQHVSPVESFASAEWDRLIALMLSSPFHLARAAWPALRGSGQGRLIAIASAHGLVASPFKAAYVSAKHGVLGLVKVLALEGAGDGITATAVCPGFVRTPLVEAQIAAQAAAHGIDQDAVLSDVILAPHAVKRLIEPDEVAEAVQFLLGPAGRTITGAPLVMDEGWTAR